MVRKLKHHEQKLLRKVDFISYKQDGDHRDKAVIRRYMIQKPEDYAKYNRICGVSVSSNHATFHWLSNLHSLCDNLPTDSLFYPQTMRSAESTRSFS
jgi:hypothetical protein